MIKFISSRPFLWAMVITFFLFCCVTGRVHAQDTLTVWWNLEGKKEDVLLKSPTLTLEDKKEVWQKPADEVLEVLITSPQEQGFGRGYEHRDFKLHMTSKGWEATPLWLVPQMYLTIKDQDSPIWFFTTPQNIDRGGWTGFYALGPNEKLDKRHDIYWTQSRQKYANTQKWVFCRKEKKP